MGDGEIDVFELQLETVENREAYVVAIRRLYDKHIKYRLQALDNQFAAKVNCELPQISDMNPPTISPESDLEKRVRLALINDVKKQIFALEILNKTKNCPVAQLMDKL